MDENNLDKLYKPFLISANQIARRMSKHLCSEEKKKFCKVFMPTADNDVYVPDENYQGAFEREMEMCELFQYHENNENVAVNFNVSSSGITVWVHFDNAEHWNHDKGKFILHHLVKQFKLHMIGYKPEDIFKKTSLNRTFHLI